MPLNSQTGYRENLTEGLLPLLTLAEAQRGLTAAANSEYIPLRIIGRDPTPGPGRHLIERTLRNNGGFDRWTRVLDAAEIGPYARGALAAASLHNRIPDQVHPLPIRLTVDEAAEEFTTSKENDRTGKAHLTRDGIISKISHGRLEVVYLRRRERALFHDEIAALRHGATDDDKSVWQQTRARFGLSYRMEITDEHVPTFSGTLAIPDNRPYINRATDVIRIAKAEGWLDYHAPIEDETGKLIFHVPDVGGAPYEIHEDDVMPWTLGVADHFGPHAATLIAYRPGLV